MENKPIIATEVKPTELSILMRDLLSDPSDTYMLWCKANNRFNPPKYYRRRKVVK